MFGIEKERLVESLEIIRKRLCCYSPESIICDCKYLRDDEKYPDPIGENTGCCEVRMAMHLIKAMTQEEFETLCKRGYII